MAKQALSNLQPRAATIKNETQEAANTALRVGGVAEDTIDSAVFEYDPLVAYKPNQWVIFSGSLAQCITATTAGQSPVTQPAKWSRKIVTSVDQIALGSELPVSANALELRIRQLPAFTGDIPNATTTQFGKVRQASKAKVDEGTNDTDYVTSLDLHNAIKRAFMGDIIGEVVEGSFGDFDGGEFSTDFK